MVIIRTPTGALFPRLSHRHGGACHAPARYPDFVPSVYGELKNDGLLVGSEPLWLEFKRRGYGSFEILDAFDALRSPPIDVEGIAKRLGVDVAYACRPGWEGAVEVDETGAATIWVNDDAIHTRQRFTIAHELGHLMLHPMEGGAHFRDVRFGYGQPVPFREREANAFAGSLLMPRLLMLRLIHDTEVSELEMARMFDVSPPAMSVRISWILEGHRDK